MERSDIACRRQPEGQRWRALATVSSRRVEICVFMWSDDEETIVSVKFQRSAVQLSERLGGGQQREHLCSGHYQPQDTQSDARWSGNQLGG